MCKIKDLMMLYALTSVHVGSGDSLNYVDLPIQREKHTNFPIIEASSLKGGIKRAIGNDEDQLLGGEDEDKIASSVYFSDARLLFFPVKSVKGIFAYVTCPLVIKRFMSDCKIVGIEDVCEGKSDWLSGEKSYVALSNTAIVLDENQVGLDEYIFPVESKGEGSSDFTKFVKTILAKLPRTPMLESGFLSRTILIGDDEFSFFVNNSTEVVTRIKIEDSGIVKPGALFTQENLPPESILYSLLFFTDSKKNKTMFAKDVQNRFYELFATDMMQVGGDMTLGKGMFSKKMWLGGEKEYD